jgi:hypothetical protein
VFDLPFAFAFQVLPPILPGLLDRGIDRSA